MTRWPSRSAMAMAYSAMAVFPAEVCADTSTDSLRSRQSTDCCWNGSSLNLYSFAGGFLAASVAAGTVSELLSLSGRSTACRHALSDSVTLGTSAASRSFDEPPHRLTFGCLLTSAGIAEDEVCGYARLAELADVLVVGVAFSPNASNISSSNNPIATSLHRKTESPHSLFRKRKNYYET